MLPETGAGLYLRLAAATLCLLIPGSLVARALGCPSVSGAVVWSLTGLTVAAAVMFLVHGSLGFALVLYLAIAIVALPFALFRPAPEVDRETLLVGLGVVVAGIGFGIALWSILGALEGDGLFHLARIRKLDAFGSLSLRSVDEFKDGGLHPGYAFPLWHVFVALVSRLAGADPGAVLLHEPTVLVPVAFAVAYEAGVAVLRRAWAGLAAGARAGRPQRPGAGERRRISRARAAREHRAPPARAGDDRGVLLVRRAPGWPTGLTVSAAALR